MTFVDSNYFLRFLLNDHLKQHQIAKKFFMEAAQGRVQAFTSSIVLFEVYWVLSSFYEKKKADLAPILGKVLDMDFISLTEREILKEAIGIYLNSNLGLEDAYYLAYSKKCMAKDFKTFDKKLYRLFLKRNIKEKVSDI